MIIDHERVKRLLLSLTKKRPSILTFAANIDIYFHIVMNTDTFAYRHIGPREEDLLEMLKVVGVKNLEELISQTIPDDIRLEED